MAGNGGAPENGSVDINGMVAPLPQEFAATLLQMADEVPSLHQVGIVWIEEMHSLEERTPDLREGTLPGTSCVHAHQSSAVCFSSRSPDA